METAAAFMPRPVSPISTRPKWSQLDRFSDNQKVTTEKRSQIPNATSQ
jgi:hypothetical protein